MFVTIFLLVLGLEVKQQRLKIVIIHHLTKEQISMVRDYMDAAQSLLSLLQQQHVVQLPRLVGFTD